MQSEVDRLSRKCITVRNALEAKQAEIERLTRERDEARTAARYCGDALNHTGDGRLYMQALAFWPWINQMAAQAAGGDE